jgi:hypothetical protein
MQIKGAGHFRRSGVGRFGSATIILSGVMLFVGAVHAHAEHFELLIASAVLGTFMVMSFGEETARRDLRQAAAAETRRFPGELKERGPR